MEAPQVPTSTNWADGSSGNKRKLTAVGTVGELGQSFTVYEKNWICPQCQLENYPTKHRCHRCRCRKPQGSDKVVPDTLPQASGAVWREAIDGTTQQMYYYNTQTGETRWDRPPEMGHAPHATGWFGRGKAGGGSASEYEEKNKLYLTRPAPKQKEHIETNRSVLEGANEYNIWYGKYIGEHWTSGRGNQPAESRCNVERDAGYTKADRMDPKSRYFCIHFARGVCARGHECQYFHRIPIQADDAIANQLKDCFGRDRHANHRDDMNGVGSFTNPSRTLFVGGVQKSNYSSQEELEAALWKHFGEWGEVEHINFVPRLSIAFVRYRLRTNTEFAKEAMGNQPLDGNENLNIKWAYDDPNPVAKQAIARADHDAAMALLQAQGVGLRNADFDYSEHYQMPESKRVCIGGEEVTYTNVNGEYPDTDAQYGDTGGGGGGDATTTTTTTTTTDEQEAGAEVVPVAEAAPARRYHNPVTGEEYSATAISLAWQPVWDDQSGGFYYFNGITQETTWENPFEEDKGGGMTDDGDDGGKAEEGEEGEKEEAGEGNEGD